MELVLPLSGLFLATLLVYFLLVRRRDRSGSAGEGFDVGLVATLHQDTHHAHSAHHDAAHHGATVHDGSPQHDAAHHDAGGTVDHFGGFDGGHHHH